MGTLVDLLATISSPELAAMHIAKQFAHLEVVYADCSGRKIIPLERMLSWESVRERVLSLEVGVFSLMGSCGVVWPQSFDLVRHVDAELLFSAA